MAAGFSEAKPKGFAALMPKGSAYEHPNYGFAQYIDNPEESTKPTRPTRRRMRTSASERVKREKYPFSDVELVMRLDVREGGRPWKRYMDEVETSARHLGRIISYKRLGLVFATPEQFNGALTETFSDVAEDPDPSRRKRLTRDVVNAMNSVIADMIKDEYCALEECTSQETPELLERIKDPLNPKWFNGELAQNASERDGSLAGLSVLYQPRTFIVAADRKPDGDIVFHEGYGPNGLGIRVEDNNHSLSEARYSLVSNICSEVGMDGKFFRSARQMIDVVQLLDTHPIPVEGMHYSLPKDCPIEFAARSPHIYAPDC